MELARRVEELEARVARLEQGVHSPSGRSTPDPESFWVLEGLRARAPGGGVVFAGTVTLPTGESYEWQYGLPANTLLPADWSEQVEAATPTLAALGHPVRLTLLGLVLTGPGTVAELQQTPALGTSGQLYHHLRQLVAAGWLRSAGRGQYTVPPDRVIPLLVILAATRR